MLSRQPERVSRRSAHYDRLQLERDPKRCAELPFPREPPRSRRSSCRGVVAAGLRGPCRRRDRRVGTRRQQASSRPAREVLTDCLMVLTLAGRVPALWWNFPALSARARRADRPARRADRPGARGVPVPLRAGSARARLRRAGVVEPPPAVALTAAFQAGSCETFACDRLEPPGCR